MSNRNACVNCKYHREYYAYYLDIPIQTESEDTCLANPLIVFDPVTGELSVYSKCYTKNATGNCPDFQQKLSLWQRIFG